MRFGVEGSTRMTIDSNGDVGINETSPAYKLEINEGALALTKSDQGHISEYLGSFQVGNNQRLMILINHPSGGYHRCQGTIRVVGGCGGHGGANVASLIRHFTIETLTNYPAPTSNVSYDDVHSSTSRS